MSQDPTGPRHLQPVIKDPDEALVPLKTIPTEVRTAMASILAKAQRGSQVLGSNAAHPAVIRKTKDDLVALSKEALALWSLL